MRLDEVFVVEGNQVEFSEEEPNVPQATAQCAVPGPRHLDDLFPVRFKDGKVKWVCRMHLEPNLVKALQYSTKVEPEKDPDAMGKTVGNILQKRQDQTAANRASVANILKQRQK